METLEMRRDIERLMAALAVLEQKVKTLEEDNSSLHSRFDRIANAQEGR